MDTIINDFYSAFQAMDAEKMVDCYHSEIQFEDPAFGTLTGNRAGIMWRMLVESQKGKDFKVEFKDVLINGDTGSAHWEAWYTFSKTGRKIHNVIDASFEFKDGKIIRHIDHFDLHRWARQALGAQGFMIGWSGFFKKKLQNQTNRLLDKFEAKKSD